MTAFTKTMKKIRGILLLIFASSMTAFAGGWGTGGRAQTDLGGNDTSNAVAIQADGKAVVGGRSDDKMAIVRYNLNGTLDQEFGNGGIVFVEYPLGWSEVNDVKILPDQKILILGTTFNTSTTDLALVRLNPNGTLDSTFAGGGKIRTDYLGLENVGKQLSITSEGDIYALDSRQAAIYCYSPEGMIKPSVGLNGFLLIDYYQGPNNQDPNEEVRAHGLYYDEKPVGGGGGRFHVTFSFFEPSRSGYSGTSYFFTGTATLQLGITSRTQVRRHYRPSTLANGVHNGPITASGIEVGPAGIRGFSYETGVRAFIARPNPGDRTYYVSGLVAGDYSIPANPDVTDDSVSELPTSIEVSDTVRSFNWMSDGSYITNYGKKILKFNHLNQPDTSFGIGGSVSTGVVSSDLVEFQQGKVLQIGSKSQDFYVALYDTDGSLAVESPPVITSPTTASSQIGIPFEYEIAALNNPTSYSTSSLPDGLAFDTSSGVPLIVGSPLETGNFRITLYATNSGGTASQELELNVVGTGQIITLVNPGAKILGSLPFSCETTTTSGLPVSISVISGPATVIDNSVYLTGLGDVVLAADQQGDANYTAASQVSITFTVSLEPTRPTINNQPEIKTTYGGSPVSFSVDADGPKPLSYKWLKDGSPISGAHSSTLTLGSASFLDEGEYSCLVENAHGFAIATIGSLDVGVDPDSPDSDNDGLSDSLEIYLAFLGLNPSVDSTLQWKGLEKIVGELGLGGGYTAEQITDLAMGVPVLTHQQDGTFLLELELFEASDLGVWNQFQISPSSLNVQDGKIRATITPTNEDTKFYKFYGRESQGN